jgi:hypothetical protein
VKRVLGGLEELLDCGGSGSPVVEMGFQRRIPSTRGKTSAAAVVVGVEELCVVVVVVVVVVVFVVVVDSRSAAW